MRAIKFRAWDKEFKKFKVSALSYQIRDIDLLTDYEWMQCTGLKDKNGTEIYEGDIVEVKYSKDDQVTIKQNCKVVFKEQAFGVDGYGSSKEFVPFRAFHGFTFGIVGNVYENQEWGIEI